MTGDTTYSATVHRWCTAASATTKFDDTML